MKIPNKIVWAKIYVPESESFVWCPVRLDKIWGNKIHDVEYKNKPPKDAVRICDSADEMKALADE